MKWRGMTTRETGRIEDDVVFVVECECGWQSEEIATTKYDKQRDADSAYSEHFDDEHEEAS